MSQTKFYTEYTQTGNTSLMLEDVVMIDKTNKRIGVGVTSAAWSIDQKIVVSGGTIRIVDGSQSNGYVLTSDANGVGTWQTIDNSFATDPDFYWDSATNTSYIPNIWMTGSTLTMTNVDTVADNGTKLVLDGNVVKEVTNITTGTSGTSGTSGVGSPGSSGTSGVGSPGSSGTSGTYPERSFTWVVSSPGPGVILGPRLNASYAPTVANAYVQNNTSATFNIYYGAIGSTSSLFGSDIVATTGGASGKTGSSVSAGDWLALYIASASGTVNQLVVTLTGT